MGTRLLTTLLLSSFQSGTKAGNPMSSVNIVHHKSPFKDIHKYLRIFFIHEVHPRHLELERCSWSRIESCISTKVAEIKDLMDGIGVPFNKYVSSTVLE